MRLDSRLVAALGAAIVGYGFIEPWLIRVRRFEVALANLPRQAQGTRVLQISDLHTGFVTPRVLTQRILRLAGQQNPDVIVLTGDVVSRRSSYPPFLKNLAAPVTEYAAHLEPLLRELHAPLGIWAVPGNHDLWRPDTAHNSKERGDFAPIAQHLENAGVKTLLNSNARLANGLALIGTDDLRQGSPDVARATRGITPDEAQLVLTHNPRLAALFADRNALVLSGHTHGGQARLPEPFRLYPVDSISTAWQEGWWPVGRARLYVSTGAGQIGGPFRWGVPPEICIFTLSNLPL